MTADSPGAGKTRGASARPGRMDDGKRATINDVARLANVSKKTVSRVINRSPFVRPETRDRVDAVIAALGYRPDPQARALAFRRSFLIGLIYDNPNPQYIIDMQQGILDVLRGSGFELLVHPCRRDAPRFLEEIHGFVERQRLAGVVLPPSVSEDDAVIALLNELDCPYVRIASVLLDDPEVSIVTHDADGAMEAARCLAELGHTRIAHISGPPGFRSAHERRGGFVSGLSAMGLKLDPQLDIEAAYTFESGLVAGARLLAMKRRPTAVFCGNDEMAAGLCQAARDAKLDIGVDISVIGFDDSPLAARLWPPLTSVLLPVRMLGRIAAARVIGEAAPTEPPAEHLVREVRPRLVVRASTGPPRA